MRPSGVVFLVFLCASARLVAGPLTPPAEQAVRDYVSRTWITDQGLPHSVVTRVQQDRAGYLWLATPAGLTRFDGREFTVFPPPAGASSGNRNIRDLTLLADGSILFLPASGGIYTVKNGVVAPHPLSAKFAHEPLYELFVEPGGAIWLEANSDIVRCDGNKIERFGPAQGINRRFLHYSWASDRSGRTWIGGTDFLGFYRDGQLIPVKEDPGTVFRVAPARSGGIWVFGNQLEKWDNEQLKPVSAEPWKVDHGSIRSLFEDHTGKLWLATSRAGVFRFDGQRFEAMPGFDLGVDSITEDTEENLWLATDGSGIRRLRARVFTQLDIPASAMTEDDQGAVWLAAHTVGVVRRTDDEQHVFPFRYNRAPLHVNSVCVDPEGKLWLASPVGLFQSAVTDPTHLVRLDAIFRNPRLLFRSKTNDVWVATGSSLGYFRQNTFNWVRRDSANSGDEFTSVAEDGAGRLWFGTSRGRLYQYSHDNFSPEVGALPSGEASVHAIWTDPNDRVWLGTTEGLVLIDGKRTFRFSETHGLPDAMVLQLLGDDLGNLWFGTPRGLFRVAAKELLAVVEGQSPRFAPVAYGPEQGLTGISPMTSSQPNAWKDRHGRLWFCTYSGVVSVDPARLPSDAPTPPVFIDRILVDDHSIAPGDIQRLPPGSHQLEFRFSALSYAAPERVQLRHWLEGADSRWVETSPDRVARYSNLAPGRYRLRVVACNSEGVWNTSPTTLAFSIPPTWWQTIWFRAAEVLAFAGVVGWGARFWSQRKLRAQLDRVEREHALEKERARIARDMHDDLGGSMTSINLLLQRLRGHAAPPETTGVIDLLDARVRRLTVELERVVWTVSPKNNSLEGLAAFAGRFAQNLFADSKITFRVRGRENIPAIPITPDCQHHVLAIVKETSNNIIKHSQAREAEMTLAYADGVFTVSIRDDGRGFSPEAHEHSERNGLRNMRTRIAELGGQLTVTSQPSEGTTIRLEVPIQKTKE